MKGLVSEEETVAMTVSGKVTHKHLVSNELNQIDLFSIRGSLSILSIGLELACSRG